MWLRNDTNRGQEYNGSPIYCVSPNKSYVSIHSSVLSEICSILLLDKYTFITTWKARFRLEFQNPWSSGPECVGLKPDNKWVQVACHYLSQVSRGRVESWVSVYFNNASSMGEQQVIHENLLCTPP